MFVADTWFSGLFEKYSFQAMFLDIHGSTAGDAASHVWASHVKDLIVLLIHRLTTAAKLLGPGGVKSVVADSLLMKQQLLVSKRSRQRAPNLSALDQFPLGFWSLLLKPRHIQRAAVIVRPSTLLRCHEDCQY